MIDRELEERLFAAKLAAVRAGNILLSKDDNQIIKPKGYSDVVTTADLETDEVIRDTILQRFGWDTFHSEDGEDYIIEGSYYTWDVDSLDGTKHHLGEFPLYAVCISLRSEKELTMGVVYDPNSGYLFHAIKDNGAFLSRLPRKKELTERDIGDSKFTNHYIASNLSLEESIVFYEPPSRELPGEIRRKRRGQKDRIEDIALRTRSLGVGSLSICYACRMGGYVDFSDTTKYYDVNAAELIARGAGAIVTQLEPFFYDRVRLLVCNEKNRDELYDILGLSILS